MMTSTDHHQLRLAWTCLVIRHGRGKGGTMNKTFRAFLYGLLILAVAMTPLVISAIEQFGGT